MTYVDSSGAAPIAAASDAFCSGLAVDIATAFDQIFSVGAVYGAGAFAMGCVFGAMVVFVVRGRAD